MLQWFSRGAPSSGTPLRLMPIAGLAETAEDGPLRRLMTAGDWNPEANPKVATMAVARRPWDPPKCKEVNMERVIRRWPALAKALIRLGSMRTNLSPAVRLRRAVNIFLDVFPMEFLNLSPNRRNFVLLVLFLGPSCLDKTTQVRDDHV